MSGRKVMFAAAVALIAAAGSYIACDTQTDDPRDGAGTLILEMESMSDFPLRDLPSQRPTALLVDFARTSVHHTSEGWIDLGAGGIFDLLHPDPYLQRIIGTNELPDGVYDEIRFEVRIALVRVDGKWYEVEVPSGSQSGIKIHTMFCMVEGDPENLRIEFDVDDSLHYSEQRGYWMTPSMDVHSMPSCTDDLATPPPSGPRRPMHG
jgi:hypothetical protein